MTMRRLLLGLAAVLACAAVAGTAGAAGASARASRATASRAHVAASSPDVDCTLDLRQRPHFSTTGRRRGTSEVVWKVTVKCLWGKFVGNHFVSSGVRAVVPFIHVRMALYRNGGQVGQSSADKPGVSYLTEPVAGPCTAGAIYQGWGKAVAVLPPGVRDKRTGTQFAINQGWGYHQRIIRCS
jgi:hypothetical protein